MVAYARALQHWVEEINLPAGGGPHLLAEGVKELREEVKWYLSFSDEEVFWGVVLPEKEEDQKPKTLSANMHPMYQSQPRKGEAQSFWGWKKFYIHPNQ